MGAPELSPEELAAINANNMRFSYYVLITLSAIVVTKAVHEVVLYSVRYIRTLTCLNDDRQLFFKLPNRYFGWLKQHLMYAPLFNKRHGRQLRMGPVQLGILPTRFQSILITSIITMNVILCVYGIEWNGPLKIKLWHLRNRSGTLAVVNMIPLVLMAGRNNPLIGLLSVPFDVFNLLHRWFGRIVVALAVTHGVVEIISMATGATAGEGMHPSGITIFTQTLQEARFILWGFVAFVAFTTILLTSIAPLRHAFYETFHHIHIALVSLVLAALYIHLAKQPQKPYLEAVIAIWVADRVLRLLSLFNRNIGRTRTTATIETLPGDAMRITIRLARPLSYTPGQHIYLTLPTIGLWTSHPFSIAWSETSPSPLQEKSRRDLEKARPSTYNPTTPQTTLSLLLRRRSGFTSTLHKHLLSPNSRHTLPALISPPHASPPSLSSYGTLLLIAGGIGITAYLTPLRSLLHTYAYAPNTTATRRVTLVWIIRSPEHLEWIRPWMTSVLAMERRREVLRIQLFVTRPRVKGGKEVWSPSATVQMFPSKPNIDSLIEMESRDQLGAMGVMVCGPGGLADDVRRAVRRRVGRRNIDLMVEGFGW